MLMQDVHMIRHIGKATKAMYIAEAGISNALATLTQNGFAAKDTFFPLVDNDFGGGSYQVTVSQIGGRVLISSVGTFQGISQTAGLEVKDNTAGALYYMMCSGTNVRLRTFALGLADINGNLHANNNITLYALPLSLMDIGACGGACCDGSVTAVNTITQKEYFWADIRIAGSVTEGAAPVAFPAFNYIYYQQVANAGGDYYNSDHDFGAIGETNDFIPTNGIIYVDGTAKFYGECNLYGGIIADKIEVRGRFNQIKTGNKNVIIAKGSDGGGTKGDIQIFYRLNVEEAVVYAARDFDVRSAFSYVTVTGSLLAGRNLQIWDVLSFVTYNHKLLQPDGILGPGGEEGPFLVVSWNR